MYGFKPTHRRDTSTRGMVRGPGTGTSDSVKDAVPPGTYIMPADSTQQIGAPALAGLGFRPGMGEAAKAAEPAQGLGFKGKRKAEGEQEEAQERGPGLGFHPAGVPVNLSNGEYKLPPEQVHAVGAQVLDAMKGATHTPAQARGFRPGVAPPPQKATDALYFADGGLVTDMNKPRSSAPAAAGTAQPAASTAAPRPLATSPDSTFPGNRAETTRGMYGQANADLAKGFSGAMQGLGEAATYLNRGDPVKDAAQAVGDFFARSAEQARQPNAWDDSGTRPQFADAKPQPAPAAVKPAPAVPAAVAPPAASSAPAQPAAEVTQPPAAPGGFPDKPTGIAGVTRIDEPGKSPMFTNVGADGPKGFGPTAGTPSPTPSSVPGLGFGPDVLGILQRENQIRAGMGPLMDQIRFNEGTKGNGNYFGFRRTSGDEGGPAVLADPSVERNAERDRSAAMSAASRPMPGSPNGQLTASQRSQMVDMAGRDQAAATARYQADTSAATQRETTAMREAGESARGFQREAGANNRAQAANEIQQAELGMKREAQGFQTREAQRKESLIAKYEAAKTPEERAQIAQQIRDLSGREPAKPDSGLAVARTNLIGELGKQYAQVQPIGDDKKPIPFETWAAPMLRAAGMGATDPRQQEGVMLKGKDGKAYQVKNGVPVLVEATTSGTARPAPAVGDVVAGHRFRGGNPNDRASWEAVR